MFIGGGWSWAHHECHEPARFNGWLPCIWEECCRTFTTGCKETSCQCSFFASKINTSQFILYWLYLHILFLCFFYIYHLINNQINIFSINVKLFILFWWALSSQLFPVCFNLLQCNTGFKRSPTTWWISSCPCNAEKEQHDVTDNIQGKSYNPLGFIFFFFCKA